jgi:hypothetical protein
MDNRSRVMSSPPSLSQQQAMLTEALAQYQARPGEYLEGVVAGLMRGLNLDQDFSWCDMSAQERNAGGRSAIARVRDYLNGSNAAMTWADGTGEPPLSIVLTADQEPDGQELP